MDALAGSTALWADREDRLHLRCCRRDAGRRASLKGSVPAGDFAPFWYESRKVLQPCACSALFCTDLESPIRGNLLRTGTKIWIGAVASLTLAQMSVSALFPAGLRLTAISDSLSVVLYVVLLTAFALNAAPTRGRLRAFWIMQAFGWGFTLISQCWWMVYDLILRKPVPILFAGDVLLFFPGILMLAGFLLRPHLGQSERSARLGLLDFCLLVIWWVFLYVCLVTCWQYVSPNNDLYNRNYDRLYLAENLVLMGVLGLLVKTSEGA